jgi:hypothetical protein
MSSIAAFSSSEYDSADWEPVFFDRIRLHIVDADSLGNINLPRPANAGTATKQQYLQSILTGNEALLESMHDFASASVLYRINTRRAIRLLHSLRSMFLNPAGIDTEDSMPGPKRIRLGGLAWHVISGEGVNKQVGAIVSAVKKASLRQLKEVLVEIQASDWSREDAKFQQKVASFEKEVQIEVEKETQEEPDLEEDLNERQRMEMVQRRLLREESSDVVKRSVADWIRAVVE